MARTDDATERETTTGDAYQLGPWNPDGAAELTASGADAEALLLAGLHGVLAAARRDLPPAAISESQASVAAPLRGQGADLAAVFGDLAADLLAQLDANGPGLDRVRLDGVLTTDDGGYTAWGYAIGLPASNPPPIGLTLDGDPTLTESAGGLTLRCTLRRETED
jgi:hypothetical protein